MGFAEHLERHFPDRTHAVIASVRSQIEERLPGFRVVRIAPEKGEPWVYATCGAAQSAADGEDGAEYVLLAPVAEPAIAEMLAALATMNADADEGIGVGSVITLGRPWIVGSFSNHLVVVPPYVFDPDFQLLEEDGRRTVVLWLIPITGAEAQLARDEGYEALAQRFEEQSVNVIDPRRASAVRGRAGD